MCTDCDLLSLVSRFHISRTRVVIIVVLTTKIVSEGGRVAVK